MPRAKVLGEGGVWVRDDRTASACYDFDVAALAVCIHANGRLFGT